MGRENQRMIFPPFGECVLKSEGRRAEVILINETFCSYSLLCAVYELICGGEAFTVH